MFPLTVPALLSVMPLAGVDRAAAWLGALQQAMLAYRINTPERMAAFLAQIAHESRELTALEENLHYSAPRLRQVFGRFFGDDATAQRYATLGPVAIANRVYADRNGNGAEASGDGWRYRGRGPLAVTFKDNYRACSIAACGDASTLLEHPEFLADPEFGAAAAAWYWDLHKCNELADRGDFDAISDEINLGHRTAAQGDSNGFADRLAYFKRASVALA
jgi:putative chitinase